jgi:hypothetical protein
LENGRQPGPRPDVSRREPGRFPVGGLGFGRPVGLIQDPSELKVGLGQSGIEPSRLTIRHGSWHEFPLPFQSGPEEAVEFGRGRGQNDPLAGPFFGPGRFLGVQAGQSQVLVPEVIVGCESESYAKCRRRIRVTAEAGQRDTQVPNGPGVRGGEASSFPEGCFGTLDIIHPEKPQAIVNMRGGGTGGVSCWG